MPAVLSIDFAKLNNMTYRAQFADLSRFNIEVMSKTDWPPNPTTLLAKPHCVGVPIEKAEPGEDVIEVRAFLN